MGQKLDAIKANLERIGKKDSLFRKRVVYHLAGFSKEIEEAKEEAEANGEEVDLDDLSLALCYEPLHTLVTNKPDWGFFDILDPELEFVEDEVFERGYEPEGFIYQGTEFFDEPEDDDGYAESLYLGGTPEKGKEYCHHIAYFRAFPEGEGDCFGIHVYSDSITHEIRFLELYQD